MNPTPSQPTSEPGPKGEAGAGSSSRVRKELKSVEGRARLEAGLTNSIPPQSGGWGSGRDGGCWLEFVEMGRRDRAGWSQPAAPKKASRRNFRGDPSQQ